MQDGALPLNMILDQVGRDKGIEKTVLIEAIEAAILTAAKRAFGQNRDLEARISERTQELAEANIRLARLAVTDGLTGLYNHRHLHERGLLVQRSPAERASSCSST